MPIERQSEQFGIFEDLPMPERTAALPEPTELVDLLAGPAITAGLLNTRTGWHEGQPWTYSPENAVPEEDEPTEWDDEDDTPFGDPERWIPEESVLRSWEARRTADEDTARRTAIKWDEGINDKGELIMNGPKRYWPKIEENDRWDDDGKHYQVGPDGKRIYSRRTAAPMPGLGEGGASMNDIVMNTPVNAGRPYGLPGAALEMAKQINLDPSLKGSGDDVTPWNPGPKKASLGVSATAADALRIARQLLADMAPPVAPPQDPAAAQAAPAQQQPAPQQQQAPPEPPTHLWDPEAQQPACGVDQPINVSSNPQETSCVECQIAMQRKEQEMKAEEMKQLMQNPMQAMGSRRTAEEHQPVDVHELLEDTVPDPGDRPEPTFDGESLYLEVLKDQDEGHKEAATHRYAEVSCECGCAVDQHVGGKDLRCRCGSCDNLTVRV